jgi:hypothetical protein
VKIARVFQSNNKFHVVDDHFFGSESVMGEKFKMPVMPGSHEQAGNFLLANSAVFADFTAN